MITLQLAGRPTAPETDWGRTALSALAQLPAAQPSRARPPGEEGALRWPEARRAADVIVVRKLGVPFQPELAMGAIGEAGVRVIDDEMVRGAGHV